MVLVDLCWAQLEVSTGRHSHSSMVVSLIY
jgi:hypothetical protein